MFFDRQPEAAGVEEQVPVVTQGLDVSVQLFWSAAQFIRQFVVPQVAHHAQFPGDVHRTRHARIIFHQTADGLTGHVDVRVQVQAEVRLAFGLVAVFVADAEVVVAFAVEELGQFRLEAFGLRHHHFERNARRTGLATQVDQRDADQVGVAFQIVFFVTRELRQLVAVEQRHEGHAVPAVRGEEREVLRYLLELEVALEELELLDVGLVHVQLVLLPDVRSHQEVYARPTGHPGHLVDQLGFCTGAFHGDHVQLFATDAALVVHVHDAFSLKTGQGVEEHEGRRRNLDQLTRVVIDERGGDEDVFVVAAIFGVIAHGTPPAVTRVGVGIGEEEAFVVDQIAPEQLRELPEYVRDPARRERIL
ncbi:hypothetical protein D3C73_874590 [compost metagenome]